MQTYTEVKKDQIKLIKSSFYDEVNTKEKLVEFIRNAPILSMGEQCAKLEEEFAKKQGCRYSAFVSSGSAANLILIQAMLNLGYLRKGDKVAFSALTWATNVMPLIQLGLQPVPLDCELSNLNVSSGILKSALEKESDIKALFLTNVLGFSADIDVLSKFCADNNILLLEDNCESLGSKVAGKLLGNYGLASTFSTFVGHHLSTIEGGFVCTNDENLVEMLRLVRAHGWDRNLPEENKNKLRNENNIDYFYSRYTFYDLAYNTRPTEIQGFLGNIQVGFWDEIVAKRERNFFIFHEAVKSNDDLIHLEVGHMDTVSNFAMPIVFKDKTLFRKYKDKFESRNVEIRPVIAGNISRQPFFKKYVNRDSHLENADFIHENGLYFANNPELTDEEVNVLSGLISRK
ncbi:hypothetical protein A2415_00700 [candidate division WWE3 bacterium RIFOXYC1_FULL_39_7]|uniref:DegT/DnrJ/EryC1/StrS aminotransferase n=2 Tax=Katanobacteria TaxID=422282 RepID=A0A1F4X6P6_UNCKA|nr:MAG: hypothetical protein A2415_00700 [candidate division WWE3 bacterium RIFOXYC1_FULL_39_7]OGC77336.1 MAG: hypothetical protein A2619_04855 [candidate division WWE3 bacterium RIFOXYD1_FULL_39_9]